MCKEYVNLKNGEKLEVSILGRLNNNSALRLNSDIWKYWDFDMNNIDIYKITKGSSIKAWWYCDKCNDSYPQAINKKFINRGCSICKGYYVTKVNSFGDNYPNLMKEWNYELNININPYAISYGSGKLAWFTCNKCKMDYECTLDKKTTQNAKCPYCRGLRISAYNNLKITHPEIAEYWDYEKNGDILPEHFVRGSDSKKVYWKCKTCNLEEYKTVKNKKKCLICSDNLSFGERNMINILKLNNIDFTREKIFHWLPNKRYDFYIPKYDTIIEIHGSQHYIESNLYRQSLDEVRSNDNLKLTMAMNKVKNYITIKSIDRNIDNLINNIKLSGLLDIMKLNLEEIKVDSNYTNLKLQCWNLWNSGYTVKEIIKELKLSDRSIRRYLKDGTKLGKCEFPKNYDNHEPMIKCWELYNLGHKTSFIANELGMNRKSITRYLNKGHDLNKVNYLEKKYY